MTPLLASLLLVLCPQAHAQAGWAGGESIDEGRVEERRAESRPRPLALLTEEELEVESDVAEVEVGAGVTLLGTAVALLTLAVAARHRAERWADGLAVGLGRRCLGLPGVLTSDSPFALSVCCDRDFRALLGSGPRRLGRAT